MTNTKYFTQFHFIYNAFSLLILSSGYDKIKYKYTCIVKKRCGSNRKDKKDENAYSDNRDGRYGHGTEMRTLSGSG